MLPLNTKCFSKGFKNNYNVKIYMLLWKPAFSYCFGGLLTSHSINLFTAAASHCLYHSYCVECPKEIFILAGSWLSGVLYLQGDASALLCLGGMLRVPCSGSVTPEANPEHAGREKAGEKPVVEAQVGYELPVLAGDSFSFRKRPFPVLFTE